ncbi:unnamed protein product [Toxocara canis]|uniref:Uncharacterized protein n=1 Tax=Toxocara canis TaxID=6265 RepID=A0A183USN8_TOXCA|nr:unnamed protein product [Toxocara canis]
MTSPWGNVCDREARPSPLGQFLSKLGATKTRSKSPTITLSLKCRTSALPSKGTIHIETTNDKRTLMLDETIITDVGLTRTPPQKPKRTSSPFARVMNRLSMSRKHSGIASNEQMVHDAGSEMLNAKATKSPPPVASVSPSYAASPRPAISESDLRHITLRRGHALASEITPLSGAIPFRSEDNLMGNSSMRTPSYLRVSCALNGYRQYRRLDLNSTPLKTPASALPLSNVQRRTLLFCSPESQRFVFLSSCFQK